MPFGLKNAPSNFQRIINSIFRDFIDARKVIIYIDDILIASSDFMSHLNTLANVLTRAFEYGLQLKLKKCKFGYQTLEYLGYLVSPEGIHPTNRHLGYIKNYPLPKNQNVLHTCIGLF